MDLGLKGKKILVVGASKNIGAETAKAFAEEGCKVTVVARDEKRLKALVKSLGGEKKGHGYISADLLVEGAPSDVAEEAIRHFGPFDIVVHNTGGALGLKDPLADVEDWKKVWKFNAGIAIEMNRLLVPYMKKRKWGRIIHISSMAAEMGEQTSEKGGALPYAASKAFLNAYIKGLGRDLAKHGVIVSGIMPGVVLSKGKYWEKLCKSDPKCVKDYLDSHCSIGRFGKPEEIAPFAVFLGSKQASFAAGSIIPVNGGIM